MKFTRLLRRYGFQLHQASCRKLVPHSYHGHHRYVSTISRLTSAFNTKPSRRIMPTFSETNKGLFGIPELTDYSGFEKLQEKVTLEIDSLVKEACDPDRKRKMVTIFDELSDCICRVADMADFVRVSHPNEYWREAAENICFNMGILIEKLNTNTALYEALQNVIEKGDIVETTDIDKRVAELFLFDFEQSGIHLDAEKVVMETTDIDQRVADLFLFDFEQSGIHLDAEKRQRFVDLNDIIMKISNKFMMLSQTPTPTKILDLDEEIADVFHSEGGSTLVRSLQSENHIEMVREAAYKIFLFPNPEQMNNLRDLLDARRYLANTVGFPTFAHRALKGTLAENPDNAMKFLWSVSDNIREGANMDYSHMKYDKAEMKREFIRSNDIMPWDPVFFTMMKKNEMYDIEDLVEYFSLGTCMEGLSNLFEQLFDITLETVSPSHGELWNYDIYKLAVVHKTEGVLGYIYCDFYERSGKPNQDCHFTIQGGRVTRSGDYQLPMVVLHLNLPFPGTFTPSLLYPAMMENLFHEFGHAMHSMLGRTQYQHVTAVKYVYQLPMVVLHLNLPFPSTFTPSLLYPAMMENLFHEFGHAMHSMFGRTQYQHVTGTRCPIDFAEVPSVLMEYFASDPRVLKTFAKHYKSGEAISDEMLDDFCKSKQVYIYSEMQLQVMYAILDQIYHGEKPERSGLADIMSTTDILEQIQNRHYGIPYVPKTAWQLRFGHLVGYGGKYYSYLMSRAIASKIWRDFFRDDPFNRENGEKYRRKLLAHGGEKHPKELIADLFGEEPTIQMMVDSLTEDLRTRGKV